MTTISAQEHRKRLAGIERGPWASAVGQARRKLAPIDELGAPVAGTAPISLDAITLSASNKRRSKRLATVLRPHFEDPGGITSPAEIETRDALDQALKLPQLYELAVQTGYLPTERVRRPARKLLTELLWSPPARRFVTAYDYLAVPMLATRVGVLGLGTAQPPEPSPSTALRFAGFLAHLRAFYADEKIQSWTRFLDDYVQEPGEKELLWRYLHGQRKTAPDRTTELLAGCQLFVTSLVSAFYLLDDDELGRFGLIHAYWLQKFFGYEMNDIGYVKNVEVWGPTDSWAHTIATSPHFVATGIDSKIGKVYQQQFREQVQLLGRTFAAVRLLAMSTRPQLDEPLERQSTRGAKDDLRLNRLTLVERT